MPDLQGFLEVRSCPLLSLLGSVAQSLAEEVSPNDSTAVTQGERISLEEPSASVCLPPAWSLPRTGLSEQELAPDAGRAEVLPDSPCLAELVDEQQPEAAWGFRVGREHARGQA
jgi:hypothetical protein